MVREYVNQNGYRIRASEKAYNLLYRKNGFVPVVAAESIGETLTAETAAPTDNTARAEDAASAEPAASKTNKGKGKTAAAKSKKAIAAGPFAHVQESPEETGQDAADQESQEETGASVTGQDAIEQPEGE